MKPSVLLGMSGGVDSSVAAILLKEEGYDVTGITFIISDLNERDKRVTEETQSLATQLGIRHIFVDLRDEFENIVITYFIKEYMEGKTPFPCAMCNPGFKFKKLLEYAQQNDCDFIATGHYARIGEEDGKKFILAGVDREKDQSFFLWGLSNEIRDKLVLPLGTLTKNEVRKYADYKGFIRLSKRKDSLGLCFIGGNNYREYLVSRGIKSESGNFVNLKGEVLGVHRGIVNYTVGQRHGLGLNVNVPLFVSEIKVKSNEIVLSGYSDLYKTRIMINNYYFVDLNRITDNIFYIRIRYRLQNTPCRIEVLNETHAEISLLEPLAMISKGQTAVFYDNERVVGGGFIECSA